MPKGDKWEPGMLVLAGVPTPEEGAAGERYVAAVWQQEYAESRRGNWAVVVGPSAMDVVQQAGRLPHRNPDGRAGDVAMLRLAGGAYDWADAGDDTGHRPGDRQAVMRFPAVRVLADALLAVPGVDPACLVVAPDGLDEIPFA